MRHVLCASIVRVRTPHGAPEHNHCRHLLQGVVVRGFCVVGSVGRRPFAEERHGLRASIVGAHASLSNED